MAIKEHNGILFEYETPALIRAKDYALEIFAIYHKAWHVRVLIQGQVTTSRNAYPTRQAAIDYVSQLIRQNYQHKLN